MAATVKLALAVRGLRPGRKQQAEKEGLDKIFAAAGFEWRAGLPDVSRDEC